MLRVRQIREGDSKSFIQKKKKINLAGPGIADLKFQPKIPLGRLRQDNQKFKASLGNLMRFSFKFKEDSDYSVVHHWPNMYEAWIQPQGHK